MITLSDFSKSLDFTCDTLGNRNNSEGSQSGLNRAQTYGQKMKKERHTILNVSAGGQIVHGADTK